MWRRLGWFFGLWLVSVAVVVSVAGVLKFVLNAATH